MKLLADENQHPSVVARLRRSGHDVEWIIETSPGAQDVEILTRPDIASPILLTYDREFGDLIFDKGLPALCDSLHAAEPRCAVTYRLSHPGVA